MPPLGVEPPSNALEKTERSKEAGTQSGTPEVVMLENYEESALKRLLDLWKVLPLRYQLELLAMAEMAAIQI